MNMNENFNIQGIIEIKVFEKGSLISEHIVKNLITNDGFNHILRTLAGDAKGVNKLFIGDNKTAANVADKKLYNRYLESNVSKDYADAKRVRFLAFIPEQSVVSNKLLGELGLGFKDATNDILITRTIVSDTIYLTPDNSISLSYSLLVN